jgi:hypothetical protein
VREVSDTMNESRNKFLSPSSIRHDDRESTTLRIFFVITAVRAFLRQLLGWKVKFHRSVIMHVDRDMNKKGNKPMHSEWTDKRTDQCKQKNIILG